MARRQKDLLDEPLHRTLRHTEQFAEDVTHRMHPIDSFLNPGAPSKITKSGLFNPTVNHLKHSKGGTAYV